ncbi:MAG: cytochrome b/b6 domain-containing protein [Kiritimatiellia bacterium]
MNKPIIPLRCLTLSAALLLLPPFLPSAPAVEDAVCLKCHQDADADMHFDLDAMKASVHGDTACTDCHEDLAKMKEDHDDALPVNCAGCHEDEVKAYRASEHGKANAKDVKEAATCLGCHGLPHAMLASSNTNAPTHYTRIPATCGACHAKADVMAQFNPRKQFAVIDYSNSVHGVSLKLEDRHAAVCTDCHGTHGVQKGTSAESPMYWQSIAKTCGKCHEKESRAFEASIHGKAVAEGIREAPVCTDCHGEHTIAAVKDAKASVSAAHIPETCGQCHSSERITTQYALKSGVLDTYMESFHGLASQIGGVAAANCASCHGYHDILPSKDPASSIHADNLPQTCGKCHAGIGNRLARGEMKIHQAPGSKAGKSPVINILVRVYVALILLVIGGMVVFNLADYTAKVRAHVREVRSHPGAALRMTPLLRVQHAILVITFVLLVYTGFTHKYPNGVWAWPFRALEDGAALRSLIHRVAGWAFAALFVLHLLLLVFTPRGRQYMRHLCPRWHDALDAGRLFRRNLGLGGPGPRARLFNFAEKAEYWALVWGSVVMIVTGVMLIFNSFVLSHLSPVWLEVAQVIHLYEAILATLAIVVWHFYWVIFDPHEYPMNTAWLIGRKKPLHGGEPDEKHPAE